MKKSSDIRTFAVLCGVTAAGMGLALGLQFIFRDPAAGYESVALGSVFDARLRVALSNYNETASRLRPPFTASTPQGVQTVDNCLTYMRVLNQGVRLPPESAAVLDAYSDCALLHLVRHGRQPGAYLAATARLAQTVAERLDTETLDAAFRPPEAARRGGRLVDAHVGVDQDSLRISADDGGWSMTILASGNFSGDEREDIAVRVDRGGARHYAVLTPGPDGRLAAIPLESLASTTTMPIRLR